MANKSINATALLYLSCEEQRNAVAEALHGSEDGPLVLAAVFNREDEVNLFLESVNDHLLFNIQHPYDFAHQVDLLNLVDGMAAEIKGCLGK